MLACIGCASFASFALAPSAFAASAGGCQLQGTANFSPGLNSSSQPFTYNFGGTLTGCQSSEAGAPDSRHQRRGEPERLTQQGTYPPRAMGGGMCFVPPPVPSGAGSGARENIEGSERDVVPQTRIPMRFLIGAAGFEPAISATQRPR